MQRIFSTLLLIGGLISSGLAQDAAISGRVVTQHQSQALPGVAVYLESRNQGTVSGAAGYFQLRDIPQGKYTLVCKYLGFETHRQEVELSDGPLQLGDIALAERITQIDEAQVLAKSITSGYRGVDELAGSAHYLGPKELARMEYNDIHRQLRSVPGVYIQEEDGFGLRPNIGMRGTGVERSSKITVMEDGILAAPAPYSAPAAYYFPTTGRMQGVEVRKGSSQIQYGPYTTGGALNLISTAIPDEFTGKVDLLAGNFGQRRLHANVGESFKNFGFMVETYQASADGFKELDFGGPTGFDIQDYQMKFRVNTDRDAKVYQSLTFKLGQTVNNSDETYLGLTRDDFDENPYRRYAGSANDRMETEQRQYALTYHLRPSNKVDVSLTAYRNEFQRNWYKLDKLRGSQGSNSISSILANPQDNQSFMQTLRGFGSDTLTLKNNNREYYSQGVQAQADFILSEGNWQQDLKIGLRLHEDQIDRFQWVDDYRMASGNLQMIQAGTPGTESNRVQSATALASFAEYRLSYDQWTFTPGLRYENIRLDRLDYGTDDIERAGTDLSERENQVDVWIPGASLSYEFNSRWSSFAGVHKGFSPPGASEETRPEESINYELGARFRQKESRVQATAFYNDYSNLLGSDLAATGGAGTVRLFNGGAARVMGLELEAGTNLLPASNREFSLPVSLSYTFTDARFQNDFDSDFSAWGEVESGDQLPYLSAHMLALQADLNYRRFSLGSNAIYTGAMRTQAGQGSIDDAERIPHQFMLDMSLSYRLNRYLNLFAAARNVTDEVNLVATRPAGLRPAMPRSFLVGVKARF